jgi:hypothetical protein
MMALLIILYILLQLADVYLTHQRVFKQVGYKEANPVMRYFMRVLGKKWFIPKLILALAPLFLLPFISYAYGIVLLSVLVAISGYIVYHNVIRIKK